MPPTRLANRVSQADVETLKQEYLGGDTAAVIGNRHDLAKSSVIKVLREAGVPIRRRRLSPTDLATIKAQYRQGASQTEIARHVGTSPSAVWHALERMGLVG